MARTYDIDMTVLGGLPVTIEFTMQGAERDVGIMSDYCEEWWVTHINGKKVKKSPEWLYKRIREKKGEEDRIVEECANYAGDDDGSDW